LQKIFYGFDEYIVTGNVFYGNIYYNNYSLF
jgi:hypothetical protein